MDCCNLRLSDDALLGNSTFSLKSVRKKVEEKKDPGQF